MVLSGQMLSGTKSQNAVGNTTLTEAVVCLVGFVAYFATRGEVDWGLTVPLTLGAVASTPLSAYTVKRLGERKLQVLLATAILALGAITLARTISA